MNLSEYCIKKHIKNHLSEFSALALPLDPTGAIKVVKTFYDKMPLVQSSNMMRVLISHMSLTSDDSSMAASDLLLDIAMSLKKRELNKTETAVPLIQGLESESTSCRSGVLTAVNGLSQEI